MLKIREREEGTGVKVQLIWWGDVAETKECISVRERKI